VCPTPGQQCIRTDCGNGVKEGTEQCDDANNDTADGCSPFCRREPVCPSGGGACNTSCGDGLLLAVDMAAGQQCDDGNTVGGDGCSATCMIESGYQCTTVPVTQNPLILPVVYRDFKGFNETGGHPDFERYSGNVSGVVQPMLSGAGKPLHVAGTTTVTTNNKPEAMGTDFFAMWYSDNATYNKTIPDFLTFTQLASGVYQFDQSTDANLFFPIDGRGWGNYPGPGTDPAGAHRNFHFTSEVRYWFEYKGGEKLDFTGDDDVWFFINRRLAVDLGGVHGAQQGTVTLHASNGTGQACDIATPCSGATRTVDFGLVLGSVYEVVVFQAERHTTRSRYKLTLSNFTGSRSSCATVCGDGIVAGNETCDLGPGRNTGAYGTCNANCTLPPRCGDAIKQPNEQCDDGVNLSIYGGSAKVCAPGCVFAGYCGDGSVNAANGEVCDQGADNGKGYGFCSATCQLGPRCGDGIKQDPPEECDDGKNDGSYGSCGLMCKLGPRCGDMVVQMEAGEVCDKGAANESNPYGMGKCSTRCRPAPYCGDKKVDVSFGEGCDDGVNSGQPGSCKTDCSGPVPLPSCGDGTMQAGEQCDDGANNGTAGSMCDTTCHKKCGNGFRDPGETCDDGKNDGSYGGCNANCTPAGYCGDGVKQAQEGCDLGMANESNPYGASKCTLNCMVAPYCGDGRIQTAFGETCDGTPGCSNMCTMIIIQ
jgi:fibro-slime domain-containing protein